MSYCIKGQVTVVEFDGDEHYRRKRWTAYALTCINTLDIPPFCLPLFSVSRVSLTAQERPAPYAVLEEKSS
jgi:hypothetical protein